ncbi:MAG: hypothetical protein KY443_04560 [Actinobacteria bacterium]|nr:hypothetical protein [Actinomycetota bacterium]
MTATSGEGDTVHDAAHERPPGVGDLDVEAAGRVSEAFEWIERARGRLYDLHHLIGRADFVLEEAAELLDRGGHRDLADHVRRDVIGRNVLDGRWTFQIVEEFDAVYYDAVRATEKLVRDRLTGGRRHLYEAELKEKRRTPGVPGHESRPPARHLDEPD